MKRLITAGATDQTIDVFILDSTSTTGAGKTGLAYNTASLVCYYRKGATGSATALTLATQTVGGAHSDGGFVEIDATNMPGMYRLDLSDTIVATAGAVTMMLKGATGMAPVAVELQVVVFNVNDAVRLGLTALPNAAADAAGGLPISDAGGLDMDAVKNNVAAILADTGTDGVVVAAASKTGYALSAAGVQAIWDALTSALTTVGSIGKRIVDYLTGDSYVRLGSPAGADIAADIAAAKALLPAALVGGRMDANVGAIGADATAASNLAKSASVIFRGSVTGAATATTLIDSTLTQAATAHWVGRIVIFTSGDLKYQASDITAFDPALDKITFTALTGAPSGADEYVIV